MASKRSLATVDHNGLLIEIPDTQAKLTIPEGAIPEGDTVDISFSVYWGGDHPPLKETEFLSGPVVHCEPNFVKFYKPVTINIPHSARNATSKNVTVWTKRKNFFILVIEMRNGLSRRN